MRPCSKLLSKRRLHLPTIKEASEETQQDMNHTNASLRLSVLEQAVSSQDYLLSICHLAHPTFPAPSSGCNSLGIGRKGPEVRGGGGGGEQILGASDPLEYLYGGPALSTCWEGEGEDERRRRRRGREQSAEGGFSGRCGGDGEGGDQDTREGRRRGRANSIPRLTSANCPHRRMGSCPELHPAGPQTPTQTPPLPSAVLPVTHVKGRPKEGRGCRGEWDGTGEKQAPRGKPSLISQWISECKSVWREAWVKACMLPAIAEI